MAANKGAFKVGEVNNPKGRPVGSQNKLTSKAKYLLSKYYDEIKRLGIKSLVNDSTASDKLKAIIAGIPKDLKVEHSGEQKVIIMTPKEKELFDKLKIKDK